MKAVVVNVIADLIDTFHTSSMFVIPLGPIPSTKSKVEFGPKRNTQVTLNTTSHHHPPQTANFYNSSRQARSVKFCVNTFIRLIKWKSLTKILPYPSTSLGESN